MLLPNVMVVISVVKENYWKSRKRERKECARSEMLKYRRKHSLPYSSWMIDLEFFTTNVRIVNRPFSPLSCSCSICPRVSFHHGSRFCQEADHQRVVCQGTYQ